MHGILRAAFLLSAAAVFSFTVTIYWMVIIWFSGTLPDIGGFVGRLIDKGSWKIYLFLHGHSEKHQKKIWYKVYKLLWADHLFPDKIFHAARRQYNVLGIKFSSTWTPAGYIVDALLWVIIIIAVIIWHKEIFGLVG